MILMGKGYFLWRIKQREDGDPEKITVHYTFCS